MDTSSLIVAVMPIMTLIALFTGTALRSHAGGPLARANALKRISATGRKARPQRPGAHDAARVEYLYVPCARIGNHGYPAGTRRWVQEVPIVKKTAKLIYYTSDSWDRREAVVSPGCISREQFETGTRCRDNCPRDIAAGLVCARHGRGHRHCCMSWPRAVTATRLAAADKTARQTPAACGAQGTGTRGSTAHTGKIGVTDTRPA